MPTRSGAPAVHMNETLGTSDSTPLTSVKARAAKRRVMPVSNSAVAGMISMRVNVAELNGVPSARVPGEKTRIEALVAIGCGRKAPPFVSLAASGERVSDSSCAAGGSPLVP